MRLRTRCSRAIKENQSAAEFPLEAWQQLLRARASSRARGIEHLCFSYYIT
jgi:hypothetical protein